MILDNARWKSRSRNHRGRLPMNNPSELVVRIRSEMGNVFIFKLTLVMFRKKGFCLWGKQNPPVEEGRRGIGASELLL